MADWLVSTLQERRAELVADLERIDAALAAAQRQDKGGARVVPIKRRPGRPRRNPEPEPAAATG